MQGNLFQFCLFFGLIFSAIYFLLGRPREEYKRTHKVVFGVLMLTFLAEVIWKVAVEINLDSFLLYNLLFVHLRVATMLVFFYYLPFSCQIQDKILLALVVFLVSSLVISLFLQPANVMIQSYSQMFGNGLILFFSLIFFKDIIRQSKYKEHNLLSLPYFWIATFVLFSFGESFIFYFFSSLFFPSNLYDLGFIQIFVQFFAGLMFLVFGVAFYIPDYLQAKRSA
ncbi:MAG: hypothetical protein JJU34_12735 [Lunatimonas sp.]|uniref:hypothetical protein n=1 Tax=Lunatimonas sp. TaxID=2060141 RepID=UPI00263BC40C|nr:hypothetical protein [Lunatimonas sp.]MCC5938139.1 hypothetical protein [Lunatimonas sp.]